MVLPRPAVRDRRQPPGDGHLGPVRGQDQREQRELDRAVLGLHGDGPAQRYRDHPAGGERTPLPPDAAAHRPRRARLKPGPRGKRRLKPVHDRFGCRQVDQLRGDEVRCEAADPVQPLAGRPGTAQPPGRLTAPHDPAYLPSRAPGSANRCRDRRGEPRSGAECPPFSRASRRKRPALDALPRRQHAAHERIERAHSPRRERGRGRKHPVRGAQRQRGGPEAGPADRGRAQRASELAFCQQAQAGLGALAHAAAGPRLSASGHAHLRHTQTRYIAIPAGRNTIPRLRVARATAALSLPGADLASKS